MTIASGFSPSILDHWFKYMRAQREQDCVRAATQLPGMIEMGCFLKLYRQ